VGLGSGAGRRSGADEGASYTGCRRADLRDGIAYIDGDQYEPADDTHDHL